MKELDLNKSVYDLTEEYPELVDVLKDLGFAGLAFPAVRKALGKKMTLPAGCEKQKIELAVVISQLEDLGYKVINKPL